MVSAVLLVTSILVLGSAVTPEGRVLGDLEVRNQTNQEIISTDLLPRQQKFFPIFTVVRFTNSQCAGTNGQFGTCYLRRECTDNGGAPFGTCARRLGVCCVVSRTTGGGIVRSNNTYFRSPGFPGTFAGGARSTASINKISDNICQLRLQFLALNLAQPNPDGICVTDFLVVSGSYSAIPRLCGLNTGQHVYVNFMTDATPIQISIDTNATIAFERTWNILVTQHECNAVPSGCLMYYTSVAGTVGSFNYGDLTNQQLDTRELSNLSYGVCVRQEAGYCSIEWSQADRRSFTVSGNSSAMPDLLGTAALAVRGENCTSDFVLIPNAQQNSVPAGADRFCGNAFVQTRSSATPFTLTVVTDGSEITRVPPDVGNRGFRLNYRQIECPV